MTEDQTEFLPENQWRKIPQFKNYEINLNKDVRYADTEKLVIPSLAVNDTMFYHLFADDATLHLLSANTLIVVTWAYVLPVLGIDVDKET
jgi:hypothetical protein